MSDWWTGGIIPAYAGSTRRRGICRRRPGDHPRIRGEHMGFCLPHTSTPGSSPHTRGAPGRGRRGTGQRRIIPAYAGSTNFLGAPDSVASDHPRIRGEHHLSTFHCPSSFGSSPHTRGARRRHRPVQASGRIIPAYAGSTNAAPPTTSRSPDHPRIRGEHMTGSRTSQTGPGSSPHTRGAPQVVVGAQRGPGIIPAYAGSTWVCT